MKFDKKYLLILLIPLIAWGAVEWGNLTVKGNLLVGSAGELSHTIGGVAVLSKIEAQSQAGTDPGGIAVHRSSASDALGGHFLALRSRGTAAAPTVVANNDIIMRLAGVAYDGTDYEFGSEIRFEVDGTPGNNDMPGRILFLVSPDGSGTQAEALRIGNDKKATFAGTIDTALTTAGPTIVDSSGVLSSEATLALARGGSAKNMTAVNGGVVWTDADSMEVSAAGTSGTILQSNGAAAPTWITNLFTSTDTNGKRIEVANLNCDSASSITSQAGSWITSVGNISAGACAVTVTGSVFSAAPYCMMTMNNQIRIPSVNVNSSTSITINGLTDAGGAVTAFDTFLICIGTR